MDSRTAPVLAPAARPTEPDASSQAALRHDPKALAADHRRATVVARCIYAVVFLSFLTVCTVAVLTTMAIEKEKPGFKPIRVEKPISFIDRTYLDEPPAAPVQKP